MKKLIGKIRFLNWQSPQLILLVLMTLFLWAEPSYAAEAPSSCGITCTATVMFDCYYRVNILSRATNVLVKETEDKRWTYYPKNPPHTDLERLEAEEIACDTATALAKEAAKRKCHSMADQCDGEPCDIRFY